MQRLRPQDNEAGEEKKTRQGFEVWRKKECIVCKTEYGGAVFIPRRKMCVVQDLTLTLNDGRKQKRNSASVYDHFFREPSDPMCAVNMY